MARESRRDTGRQLSGRASALVCGEILDRSAVSEGEKSVQRVAAAHLQEAMRIGLMGLASA